MEADRQRMEAERQRMEQMFLWMQSLGERMGQPPPPILFPAPPSPTGTPMSMNDLVCIFLLLNLISHMQSLLLCAESIGGIE